MPIKDDLALETAKVALGPLSSLINAAIEPKVNRVREWASNKDLKGQLEPERLAKSLEEYLTSLAIRVSKMNSICFPQSKLDIEEAYEPLFVSCLNNRDEKRISVDELIANIEKSFTLIDGAGMGKSTFSKYLVSKILFKSERIPIFYELRKSKPGDDLVDNIAKELDPLGYSVFSRGVFFELLKQGKFIIVLDGFDEVVLSQQHAASDQITELSEKGIKNTLVLTSRPQEVVPSIMDGEVYNFADFSAEQAKGLIRRLDKVSNNSFGEKLIDEFESVPDKFLQNPLLVSLLYTTFGTNNSIADRISTFYDEVYDALYKGHDLKSKNGFRREKLSGLDIEDFRVLLRAMCFQMVVTRKASFNTFSEAIDYVNQAVKASKINPTSTANFVSDLQNAVPLVQKDGHELRFMHKTIVEYFAAEYIVYKPDSRILLQKMFDSNSFSAFSSVFDFVYELSSELYDEVVTKFHANKLMEAITWPSTQSELVLRSSMYIKSNYISLWPVDEYTKTEKIGHDGTYREDFDIGKAFKHLNEGIEVFNAGSVCSRVKVAIDGVEYYLAILTSPKDVKFHQIAYKKLTDELLRELPKEEDFKALLTELGECNWTLLDEGNVSFLSRFDLISHKCSQPHLSPSPNRIFSREKIESFMDTLQAQEDMYAELDDLLS
ncbi:hypothetical protein LA983_001618 [Vibrio fluvialis]|nr:hypothetical protein [Vibrio fluvialis]